MKSAIVVMLLKRIFSKHTGIEILAESRANATSLPDTERRKKKTFTSTEKTLFWRLLVAPLLKMPVLF